VHHLLIDLLGGHLSTEAGRGGKVLSATRVASGHHVLAVEHLGDKLRDRGGVVILGVGGRERGKADQEEVKTREGDKVDGKLSEIRVKLTREAEGASDTRHDLGNEVVQVTIRGGGQLEGTEANIVESLVINAHYLISVLNELVSREGSVVRLNYGVGDLRGGDDGEGTHHTVGELLTDLRDKESTHTRTGSTTERVGNLETLEAIASLSLLADDVEDVIYELSTLSVVSLGPVVTSTALSRDEGVGAEHLSELATTDSVKSSRLCGYMLGKNIFTQRHRVQRRRGEFGPAIPNKEKGCAFLAGKGHFAPSVLTKESNNGPKKRWTTIIF
jgi:hypothetical protein